MGRSRTIRALCLISVGLLICGLDASAATGDERQARVEQKDVDLYLMRGAAALIPGGAADRAMTVLNNGRDMVGEIELYFTTPIFINIDERASLPAGCAMYHRNKDYHIPEIVKCTLGPLKSGQAHELSLPIKISDEAPAVQTYGTAFARSARPDLDPDRNLVDNVAVPGGAIALPPDKQAAQGERRPHLAMQSTTALVSSATSSESIYRLLNLGTDVAKDARVVVVTPLYVNTSTAGELPSGCSMVLRDPDPAVPEIVECAVGTLDPSQSREFRIPVKAVPGGPNRQVFGATVIYAKQPSGRSEHTVGDSSYYDEVDQISARECC